MRAPMLCFLKIHCLLLGAQCAFAQTPDQPALDLNAPALEAKKSPSVEEASGAWAHITPSLDSRFLVLLKERPAQAGREGLGLMQAVVGLDWSLEDNLQAVARYNLGFLGPGTRELYFDFLGLGFESFKVGRFPLTFGFRVADHRIYTKRFFGVSINDFETGFEARKAIGPMQLTLAMVQGLGGGESFETNKILVTPVLDARWDFEFSPVAVTLGTSAFQTLRLTGQHDPFEHSAAATVYGRATLGRLSVTGEAVWGHKRNGLVQGLSEFVGDQVFASSLKATDSLGYLVYVEGALGANWKMFYEYDQVAFNRRYLADRFTKHGLGARWAFYKQAELEGRIEAPIEGRKAAPDLSLPNVDALLTLHAWF